MLEIKTIYLPQGKHRFNSHPSSMWQSCRDQFAYSFTVLSDYIYFSIDPQNVEKELKNLTSFMKFIESSIGIKDHTKFEKVKLIKKRKPSTTTFSTATLSEAASANTSAIDSQVVLKVHVPEFWRSDANCRSLFTLMLRCGVHYNGDLKETIDKDKNASQCKPSIYRFIKGYTLAMGDNCAGSQGWVAKFKGVSEKEVKWYLTKDTFFWRTIGIIGYYREQILTYFMSAIVIAAVALTISSIIVFYID